METATEHEDLLTTAEAARLLRVNRSTICHWAQKGKLPAMKIAGQNLRIRRQDLLNLMQDAKR